ncbi:MAG: hypothetical protein K0R24_1607, partial [Gammaproteobacteria bacterium]|nr:hypothetical protein [Gammaproteobacteria bacterium]
MRFYKDGPDIPDELLYDHEEENVIFFPGSGVSRAYANLPNFSELARKVMDALGARKDSETRQLLENQIVSTDYIFDKLEEDFDNRHINSSVARNLQPNPNPDLSAHKTILKLSSFPGKGTRLITTNFDSLFESCNRKLPSITHSNLPNVEFSDSNWGIIHLHGKVNSDYSGSANDGFVLSASQFGSAYLTSGLTRDFVREIFNRFTVVFVGYSAEDPPINYLLRGLRYENKCESKIYAFVETGLNNKSIKQWESKGIKVITYENVNKTHAVLWKTLEAWAVRASNPYRWRNKVLSKARKGPTKMEPHERGMVAHIVKSASGAKAFAQMDPPLPAEWLGVFDQRIRRQQPEFYALNDEYFLPEETKQDENLHLPAWDAFSFPFKELEANEEASIRYIEPNYSLPIPRRLHSLAVWIGKISDQKFTLWWASQQSGLHLNIIKNVQLNFRKMPDSLRKQWNAVFESQPYRVDKYGMYNLKNRIDAQGWDDFIVREYAILSSPFLKARPTINSVPKSDGFKKNKVDVIKAEVKYLEGIEEIKIPSEQLVKIIGILRLNLEKYIDMEKEFSGKEPYLRNIQGNEDSEERIIYGGYFSQRVYYFLKLFKALISFDTEQAKKEYKIWRNKDYIFGRIRMIAASFEGAATENGFVNEVFSLKEEDFWSPECQPDILICLKRKWDKLSLSNRKNIEEKILKGPPKLTKSSKLHSKISAYMQLNMFHYLQKHNCNLSFDLKELTENLNKIVPEWRPEDVESAVESANPRGGFIRVNTDYEALKILPLSEIIKNAKITHEIRLNDLVEHNPFLGLCDAEPLQALEALTLDLKSGNFSIECWEIYLLSIGKKSNNLQLKISTAYVINQIQNKQFADIIWSASDWFENIRAELRDKNIEIFNALWNKFIDTLMLYKDCARSVSIRQKSEKIDWVAESISSVPGKLAELHIIEWQNKKLEANSGFPKCWLKKTEQLLNLPNDASRYAITILSLHLSALYYVDPVWAEERLLKIIQDDYQSKD